MSSHSLISLMGENERLSSPLSIQVVFNQSSRPTRKTSSTDVAEWFGHSTCRQQVQSSLCPLDVSRYNVVRCADVRVFDLNHRHQMRSKCCDQIHDSRLELHITTASRSQHLSRTLLQRKFCSQTSAASYRQPGICRFSQPAHCGDLGKIPSRHLLNAVQDWKRSSHRG